MDDASRQSLLARARTAIARAIGAESGPRRLESPLDSVTLTPTERCGGAFVTLRINGDLRGCIGYPESELPLADVVERCAVSAALSDPRFPPLTIAEWSGVNLEISVLGPIEPVADIDEIEVGRHGLIVQLGHHRGLLLPQVATEWKWNAAEFAAQTCGKAGLPRDAWQKGAKLYKFEAEVFGA